MAAQGNLLKLVDVESDVTRPGDLLLDIGTDAFDVSATEKEVTTQLTEVLYAFLNIDDATPIAADLLATDKVVTTSAVTVARTTGTTADQAFSFMFIGRKSVIA